MEPEQQLVPAVFDNAKAKPRFCRQGFGGTPTKDPAFQVRLFLNQGPRWMVRK
jgi:hypothetical protein